MESSISMLQNYRNRDFQKLHSQEYFKLIEQGQHINHTIPELYQMAYNLALPIWKVQLDSLRDSLLQK